MAEATITSKGQVTIPKAVREVLGLQAGDRVEFVEDGAGGVRLRPIRGDIRCLKGMLAREGGRPVGVEEMNEAIEAEAAERHRT